MSARPVSTGRFFFAPARAGKFSTLRRKKKAFHVRCTEGAPPPRYSPGSAVGLSGSPDTVDGQPVGARGLRPHRGFWGRRLGAHILGLSGIVASFGVSRAQPASGVLGREAGCSCVRLALYNKESRGLAGCARIGGFGGVPEGYKKQVIVCPMKSCKL